LKAPANVKIAMQFLKISVGAIAANGCAHG